MNQYEHTLMATKQLLCAVGENHWAKWVQDGIERWRDTQDTSYHLSGYAGMGSFTDIYISRQNRHTVTELQEPWVNTLLLWLQALCFFLAKQPHSSFKAETLFNSVGMFDAPLSALAGGDTADPSTRGLAAKSVLLGERCFNCGYARVSHLNLETFIAKDVLPGMVFHSCETLTLDRLVDQVLAGELDVTNRREQMVAALSNSNIFLSDSNEWMRPCPNCGSDDTGSYYWKRATNGEFRFIPDY
ncbi:MAG: hypothetical protein J2P17_04280 [Mycobacterium sp.]|nr:hypothetical protein [Mycobacterium sp.]